MARKKKIKRKRHCKKCGKKLSKYNKTGECFHHSLPSDRDPVGDWIRYEDAATGGITGNNTARTQTEENGGYAYE